MLILCKLSMVLYYDPLSSGDLIWSESLRWDALLWNVAADMHAWGGQDSEPRPPLLQARAWQSGEPGDAAQQLLRDEACVSYGLDSFAFTLAQIWSSVREERISLWIITFWMHDKMHGVVCLFFSHVSCAFKHIRYILKENRGVQTCFKKTLSWTSSEQTLKCLEAF